MGDVYTGVGVEEECEECGNVGGRCDRCLHVLCGACLEEADGCARCQHDGEDCILCIVELEEERRGDSESGREEVVIDLDAEPGGWS